MSQTPLEQLSDVISQTVNHISDFTKRPGDFTRNRKLNAETTIKVALNMGGQSLNTELIHAFPNMDERMTASAYEQQKAKLSPEIFLHILRKFSKTNRSKNLFDDKYKLYAIDGSDFTIPYQSKSKYAMPNPGSAGWAKGEDFKPISQLHANLLYNLTDRTYEDVVIQERLKCDERTAALDMLENLHPEHPYIVIMDRGYESFNMFMHGNDLNGDGYFIIRTRTGGIKEIAEIPDEECDVDLAIRVTTSNRYYVQNKDKERIHMINSPKKSHKKEFAPSTTYSRWDYGQFETIQIRVVKFKINDPDTGKETWETLATNLNRFEFPISRMKDMYHLRWDIETSFRELKYALGAVQFHSRKDDFIEMELIAHLIMFNVVSKTINAVSVPQSTQKKYKYVISFKDAVTLVRKYYRLFMKDPPDGIFREMLGYTRPVVPGRKDKRNMKVKSAVWFVYRVA